MKIKWFEGVKTQEELKKRYRELAKKYHPDLPTGDTEKMKEINNEYDYLKERLKNGQHKQQTAESMDAFRDAINTLVRIPDVEVEICGTWIWVGGNTKPYKDTLKNAGFWWSAKKRRWYWKPDDSPRRKRGFYSMKQIREKYGSVILRENEQQQEEEQKKLLPA